MKLNNWNPGMGDFIFEEDDYAKKHELMLKREKINKIILISSTAAVVFTAFVGVLYLIGQIFNK